MTKIIVSGNNILLNNNDIKRHRTFDEYNTQQDVSEYAYQLNFRNLGCTGVATSYASGVTVVANGYRGGVYSPLQNRIYLVPFSQSNQTNWHYIDCATGTVVAYASGVTVVANGYVGGVYSPLQNRIYLVPLLQSNQANWHYIQVNPTVATLPSINYMANWIFNKF